MSMEIVTRIDRLETRVEKLESAFLWLAENTYQLCPPDLQREINCMLQQLEEDKNDNRD